MIRADGLGKKYIIRHSQERSSRYQKFSDVLINAATAPVRRFRGSSRNEAVASTEEFWALKDLDFEIEQGEVCGIIGRNGAGKSTLLKLLSRITEPSAGRITLNGRVASLLEVGTGFHPELTGRENIFLNGAILGMSRAEIRRSFDQIVDFAEVERFLDTPVKRYSSGMYVRLAFAVTAHLEPEILIVDEVLAVGDVQFQKKCIGKMSSVASGGRTVLFVSHNMAAIERLCTTGLVIDSGTIAFRGSTQDAISKYLEQTASGAATLPPPETRPGDGRVRVRAIHCPQYFEHGDTLEILMDLDVHDRIENPEFKATIYTSGGACLCSFGNYVLDQIVDPLDSNVRVSLRIPSLPLNIGSYSVNVSISDRALGSASVTDRIENACLFQVVKADPFGTSKQPLVGAFALEHSWSVSCPETTEAGTRS